MHKFFCFRQNNVRGVFRGPQRVAVEAASFEEACEVAEEVVEGWSEWCECCGHRWPQTEASVEVVATPEEAEARGFVRVWA